MTFWKSDFLFIWCCHYEVYKILIMKKWMIAWKGVGKLIGNLTIGLKMHVFCRFHRSDGTSGRTSMNTEDKLISTTSCSLLKCIQTFARMLILRNDAAGYMETNTGNVRVPAATSTPGEAKGDYLWGKRNTYLIIWDLIRRKQSSLTTGHSVDRHRLKNSRQAFRVV